MATRQQTPRFLPRLTAWATALACLAASAAGSAPPRGAAGGGARPTVPAPSTDQLIVKFRDGTAGAAAEDAQTLAQLHAVAAKHGAALRVVRRNAFNSVILRLDKRLPEDTVRAMAREMAAADTSVQFAEPDRIKRIAAVTPNDPSYALQWHYYESTAGINLPSAWSLSTGAGVVVAVIDTGYRRHVDLAANIVGGYDFISDPATAGDGGGRDSGALDPGDWTSAGQCGDGSEATDSSWHGTHVAGTIAAVTNNSLGVAGVAYGAKVLPVRVLGKCGGYDSDIADGMIWAAGGTVTGVPANANPAKVLNLSLGGFGSCDSTTQAAINSARSHGAVVVVAAGNDGDDASFYSPANCSGVISVGAVGRDGALTSYSNYGDSVQMAAPGGDMTFAEEDGILSTLNDGLKGPGADVYAYYQGTSMAAPHVAGVAALMFAKNPALTPNQVLARLRSNAKLFTGGGCGGCGAGVVDAYWSTVMATATVVTEKESNDSRTNAQTITPAVAAISGTMGTTSDVDHYKLTLGAGKQLRASMAPTSTTRDFDLQLLNSAGTVLATSDRSSGQTDRIIYTNNGGSTVTLYVKVVYYDGGTGGYTLSIRH